MKKSIETRIAQRFVAFRKRLTDTAVPEVSFGKTMLTEAEFRKRIRDDQGFRETMSSKMGPRALTLYMTGENDGGS